MVAPEVPTRWTVGQTVLDHQPHCQIDHTMGVVTARWGQIRHVGIEVLATLGAVMLRIGDHEITRTPQIEIAQIVQRPMGLLVSVGHVTTSRTRVPYGVATIGNNLWLGQVGNRGHPFAGIGSIRPWTEHSCVLRARMLGPQLYDRDLSRAIPKPGNDAIDPIYARISLSLQNKFDSKHALALWELCLDYLDESRNYGETPYIPLEQYRKLMGMSEDMYPLFKDLNKYVIKASITEINDVTDFNVTVEYARNSRKVVAIKFRVRRILQLPQASAMQPVLFPSGDLPDIVKELVEVGLSEQDAGDIWQQKFAYVHTDRRPKEVAFDYYIREKIHLLRKQDPRKVKSKTGFLLQAIKQNWTNHDYAASQKEKLKQDKIARLKALQDQKHQLEKKQEEQTSALCKRIVANDPDLLEHLLQAVLKESSVTRALYDEVKTPAHHYQNSPIFASLVDKKLMMEYPQHFEIVHSTYRAKIAHIEHEIASVHVDV